VSGVATLVGEHSPSGAELCVTMYGFAVHGKK
jgi:hypothetical protein